MLKGLRPFLSSAKYSTLQVETSQKNAYYKRLGALKDDENIKPPGWDEAQPFENIPGPKPLPIIGNIWRLLVGGSLNMMQQDQMIKVLPKEYGPIVKISSILGRSDLIYLFDPDDMEYMLRNAGVFPIREGLPCVKYYRGEVRKDKYQGFLGMVNMQAEEWYSIRTLVNKVMMHPKMVQQHTSNLNDIAKDLVNCIKYEKQKSGSNYVDITDYVYNTAIESVTAVILDKRLRVLDVNVDKNSDVYKFVQATRLHVDDMFYLDIIPYYRYLPSKRFKQYVKNMDIMMDFRPLNPCSFFAIMD